MAFKQEVLAALDRRDVQKREARRLGIEAGGVFNVHRHAVYKPLLHEGDEPLRKGAVRIELDLIAERADLAQEVRHVGVQKRLAARDGDAVEQALTLLQESENRLHAAVGRAQRLRNDQRSVVAEGTAEIAPAGENRAGDQTGIVQQRHLLQSGNEHFFLQTRLACNSYVTTRYSFCQGCSTQ